MITVTNLSKKFGRICAVNNISFTINTGEIVGFLGPNGAGKTTTMRMLTGYFAPSAGSVSINNIDLKQAPLKAKKIMGYLPEATPLYQDMVVVDFLRFMGALRNMPAKQLLARLGAVVEECSLQSVLDRKIGNLSKGYKQRVGLAQALLHDPQILILDEPTIGLDPNQILEIRTLITRIGKTKTILLSSHILSEVASTCQRILVMNQGQLVADGTPEALTQAKVFHNKYQLGIRGDWKDIQQKISALPDFVCLENYKDTGACHEFHLTCSGENNLSETIFEMAVTNNWKLTRLAKEQASLEDVFKTLTAA